jgi:hypothetical protein
VTRDGSLVGYLAVDSQDWDFKQRHGWRVRRWSETRRRFRLDLLTNWSEGFLSPEDEDALDHGSFAYKGESLTYEELSDPERAGILSERFSAWQ